jgi:hypothetical protein
MIGFVIFGSVLAGYGGLMLSKGDEFGSMLIALGVFLAAMGAAHTGRGWRN